MIPSCTTGLIADWKSSADVVDENKSTDNTRSKGMSPRHVRDIAITRRIISCRRRYESMD
jgi:hypothetical protein